MNGVPRLSGSLRLGSVLLCALWIVSLAGAGAAHAQIPGGPSPTCKQLWDEAGALADRAAQDKARAVGAAPDAGATRWAQAWTQAWNAVWSAQGAMLKPGPRQDCCHINWFELAARTGKAAWEKAWQTAGSPGGATKAWADKYAAAFADAWAREWFLHYPWLCARARARASAKAFADASAFADATASAWALAWTMTTAWADVRASVWTDVWTTAGSAAWASAGAEAMTAASASAESAALAAVSGNCALAAASACARAAAEAFAAAWASAGASAYSSAYASASAEAMAEALADAWALAISRANAQAFALAFADAYARAGASAFAAVWRVRLANEGQLVQIINWWKTPGASEPPIAQIWKLLAAAQASASKKAWDTAWDIAWDASSAFQKDFSKARQYAYQYVYEWTSSWVNSWTHSWAYAWATAWSQAYALACSRAAAVACAQCPPCTTTTTRPRTVSRPSGFTYTLIGLGLTAGSVFEIVIHNTTGETIVVEVPAGTVFRPADPDHQRMVIADNQTLTVPPNQTAQAPLQGYCLDYGKQPPPATTLGALGREPALIAGLDSVAALSATLAAQAPAVKYQVDEDSAAYGPLLRIIQAGNRLAVEGKFHTDLPPHQYKLAVIQRAVWTYATRNTPKPHTRETLLNDIRRQVKDSGGTQTEEQTQELVNHLMEDVEAVLRSAGVS